MPEYAPHVNNFKDINFGYADASKEKTLPILLSDGFLDAYGYLDDIIYGDKYYIIGQKGSGKSAIANKIELMAKEKNEFKSKINYLKEFDFRGFSGILPTSDELNRKNNRSWEFLIALQFIGMYDEEDFSGESKKKLKNIKKLLGDIGLLPSDDFNSLVDKMKHKRFKIDGKILKTEIGHSELQPRDIERMVVNVVDTFYNIKPEGKYFIFIDGLDSILGKEKTQYSVLSALIHSTDSINKELTDKHINCKLVTLCRTDLIDLLGDPNRTKFMRDSSIQLDWYTRPSDLHNNNLSKLINLRAKVSLGKEVDVIDEFFPQTISLGKSDKSVISYIFEHTRHTPRDLIQLMIFIQKESNMAGANDRSIRSGIKKYSEDYFIYEIEDSLYGFITDEKREATFDAIRQLGNMAPSYSELSKMIMEKGFDPDECLSALYDVGAIMNVHIRSNGEFSMTSKYKNRKSKFDKFQEIRVHSGLRRVWNLEWKGKYLESDSEE